MTVDEIVASIHPKAIPQALAALDELNAAIDACALIFGYSATAKFLEVYRADLLENAAAEERVARCLGPLPLLPDVESVT